MKLYTERQMKEMFRMGLANSINEDGALGQFTPIELPSDEEIDEESPYVPNDASIDFWSHKEGFVDGAKWMRDKIQGGNNEL